MYLLLEMHNGLKEVVVDPHLVVELTEGQGLGNRVESIIAQVGAYEGGVLLFDEAVIVSFGFAQDRFVIGSAAGEMDARHFLFPESLQVVVEELGAVVRVDFEHGEGDPGEDTVATVLHNAVTAS